MKLDQLEIRLIYSTINGQTVTLRNLIAILPSTLYSPSISQNTVVEPKLVPAYAAADKKFAEVRGSARHPIPAHSWLARKAAPRSLPRSNPPALIG